SLQRAVVGRRARARVVDEEDAVTDEDLVPDLDAVAHEAVALDLAAGADRGAALDLDKGADAGAVANPAPVEVRERRDDDALAQVDVVEEPVRRLVDGSSLSHGSGRAPPRPPLRPAPRSCRGRSAARA